ncbi:hypothetical protein Hypma_012603 [Hypsizygus marmoreus]|uniref:Uncharacterized protein n=1 Tax=Hypsizygus marmoreus TaxID=39966 RepID=A0A369JI48_HYPMA|nr:hypothetical protein Hypma_012603 [Hypsizygus marmoreus]
MDKLRTKVIVLKCVRPTRLDRSGFRSRLDSRSTTCRFKTLVEFVCGRDGICGRWIEWWITDSFPLVFPSKRSRCPCDLRPLGIVQDMHETSPYYMDHVQHKTAMSSLSA